MRASSPDAAPATEKLADSAGAMKESAIQQTDSADRRTELAADRTVLAAERTYAAWVRTGLAALVSGVGAKALFAQFTQTWLAEAAGSMLVIFSACCFAAAVWRELDPGAPPPKPDTRRLPIPLLIVANGFLILISLIVLAGIWMRPN